MERLTEQGVTYKSLDFMEDGIYEFINRLSAYEDTGLTPEEVKGVKTDRDYWKAEALKHCAKLGEIKLLVGRAE